MIDNNFLTVKKKVRYFLFDAPIIPCIIPVHLLVRQKLSLGCPPFNRTIVSASYTSVIATGIFV